MRKDARDAFTVDDFCKRHGISRGFVYLLWRRGRGPRFMQVDGKRLISTEAAAEWRRSAEQAAAQGLPVAA
jgi:hypothetical protein